MARRIAQPVARRVSLPLTEQDERELARLRHDPTYREALAGLAGEGQVTGEITESVLLHALLRIGLTAVETAAQQAGGDGDDRHRIEVRSRAAHHSSSILSMTAVPAGQRGGIRFVRT